MRIIDENGNEMESYSPDDGYITYETIIVAYHEAQPYIPDVFHYEIVAEYPNGGKDVVRVVDIPGHQKTEAWDETETIMRFHAYSEEEQQERQKARDYAEAFRIIIGEEE